MKKEGEEKNEEERRGKMKEEEREREGRWKSQSLVKGDSHSRKC